MHIILLLFGFIITPSILFSKSQYHANANSSETESFQDSSHGMSFDSELRYKFDDSILKSSNVYIRRDSSFISSSLKKRAPPKTKTADDAKTTDSTKTTD